MHQLCPYIEKYSELRHASLRGTARHIALNALSFVNKMGGNYLPATEKNCVQIVLLHHVFSDERKNFRNLLEQLSKRYQFISYSNAVERILAGNIDRPYLTFSFDDGLKNCRVAAEIMQEWNATGCFFVCPNIVGETNRELTDRFCKQQLLHGPVEFMDWDDLEWLKLQGHEIGGHTTGHYNLATLTTDERAHDLALTKKQIERHLGNVEHFAWPYGQFHHCNTEAMQQVFAAGFKSLASGVRGAHANNQPIEKEALCLRRESIVAAWPLAHIEYFLKESQRVALDAFTSPSEWQPNRAA